MMTFFLFLGGSFRHFLSQIAKELSSPLLNLLIPCASSSGSRNKGKCVLKPGPMTYSEERLLEFLGQVILMFFSLYYLRNNLI